MCIVSANHSLKSLDTSDLEKRCNRRHLPASVTRYRRRERKVNQALELAYPEQGHRTLYFGHNVARILIRLMPCHYRIAALRPITTSICFSLSFPPSLFLTLSLSFSLAINATRIAARPSPSRSPRIRATRACATSSSCSLPPPLRNLIRVALTPDSAWSRPTRRARRHQLHSLLPSKRNVPRWAHCHRAGSINDETR